MSGVVLIPAADVAEAILNTAIEIVKKQNAETFTRSDNVQIKRQNLYKLQDALDLLGVALAAHGHTWSVAERTAYDQATRIIKRAVK